jgi:hypothetical protein
LADKFIEMMNRKIWHKRNAQAMTGTTVGTKIWLVVALCLGVGGSGTGFLIRELKATSASYEDTLRNLQERARQQDAARVMQVTFKKEVTLKIDSCELFAKGNWTAFSRRVIMMITG